MCVCVYLRVCVCVYLRVCVCVCIYVCVCVSSGPEGGGGDGAVRTTPFLLVSGRRRSLAEGLQVRRGRHPPLCDSGTGPSGPGPGPGPGGSERLLSLCVAVDYGSHNTTSVGGRFCCWARVRVRVRDGVRGGVRVRVRGGVIASYTPAQQSDLQP